MKMCPPCGTPRDTTPHREAVLGLYFARGVFYDAEGGSQRSADRSGPKKPVSHIASDHRVVYRLLSPGAYRRCTYGKAVSVHSFFSAAAWTLAGSGLNHTPRIATAETAFRPASNGNARSVAHGRPWAMPQAAVFRCQESTPRGNLNKSQRWARQNYTDCATATSALLIRKRIVDTTGWASDMTRTAGCGESFLLFLSPPRWPSSQVSALGSSPPPCVITPGSFCSVFAPFVTRAKRLLIDGIIRRGARLNELVRLIRMPVDVRLERLEPLRLFCPWQLSGLLRP